MGSAETLSSRQSAHFAAERLSRDVERLALLFQCPTCRFVDVKDRKKYLAWFAASLITGLSIGGAIWLMFWGAGHMMSERDQAKVPWAGLCSLAITVGLSLFFGALSAPSPNLDERFRLRTQTPVAN